MPDETTILSLPLILPAQAQKHVTHNEAITQLDLIVQLSVLNRTLSAPPATPSVGDRHIVAAGATGAWAGQSGRIALFGQTGWLFTAALPGWQAHVLAEGQTAVFDGTAWRTPSEGPLSVTRLGVSATADATNRLTVSAPATLLNHAGSGHQLKLNKATAADTASLLFQTGFSGRAEMGTAGADDFSIKVSADGTTFNTALEAAAATGEVTLPRPVRLGGQAADPASPPNGTLWLNTTTGEVRVRSAGATLPLGGGGGVTDGDKGDITVSGSGTAWTIDAGAVTLGKLASIATDTFLGRDTAGTGAPEVMTPTQARTILNVANGATANATDAALRDRATHTGTQAATTISDFAEAVDDRVAALLVAGANVTLTYNDVANTLTVAASGGGGSIPDGDKGDITTSASGATWVIDAGAVTNAKLADMPAHSVKVRQSTVGATDLAIPANAVVGRGASGSIVAAQLETGQMGDNTVTNAKAADMAANTVKVNATAVTADPSDLAVGTNTVIGRVGGNIVAAQVATAQIAANAADNTILADMAANTVKVRAAATAGDPSDLAIGASQLLGRGPAGDLSPISLGTNLSISGTTLNATGGGGGSLTVQDEGSTLSAAVTTVNFTGAGVTATGTSTVTVNIPGGGGGSPTDLTYDVATRLLSSSTGADVTLPAENGPERFSVFHDFIGGGTGESGQQSNGGTGAGFSSVGPQDGGIGWLQVNLGTTAGGRAAYVSANLNVLRFGLGATRSFTRTRVNNLSDATNTYTSRLGYLDNAGGETVDGAFFRYTHTVNGGRFQAVTRANNVETAVDTGVTVAINTTYKLEIEVNAAGTSAVFRINGTTVATITTTIPVAVGQDTGFGAYWQRSVGTAAFSPASIDYLGCEQTFTGR